VKPDADPVGPAHGATVEDARPGARELGALRALLWALVAVMTVAWLFLGGGLDAIRGTIWPAPPTTAPEVGRPAPALALPLAGGGEVDLAQHRGKVVLVNFWATWCTPCRAEMPAIERTYQAHRERGLEVIAVDVQERDADVLAFLREVEVSFPSAVDRVGDVVRRYRANALPTTFLVDRQGVIRDVHVGPLTDQMLEQRLAPLL
jgi:cytochrome c biogenesis protein CcmG, thiol:disulfide interchange protein DsbE